MKLDNKDYKNKIVNEYLNYLEKIKGYSNNTIISYKADINNYLNYHENNNKNYYDIEEYIQHLSKNKYAKTTINRKIVSISTFFKWCNYCNSCTF